MRDYRTTRGGVLFIIDTPERPPSSFVHPPFFCVQYFIIVYILVFFSVCVLALYADRYRERRRRRFLYFAGHAPFPRPRDWRVTGR